MRKIRFYITVRPDRETLKKVPIDGYLDDNCEIGYCHHSAKHDPLWRAIILDCGASIAEELKLKDAVIEANENWEYANMPGALLNRTHKEMIGTFKNTSVGNSIQGLCLNRWKETDKFIDLTTIEGQKILKTIKSEKRKKKPKTKA